MPIDMIFLAIGHDPNSGLCKNWLTIDKHGLIVVKPGTQATSLPGVFAAGDVEDHYRQGDIAAAHGKKAAINAVDFLRDIGFYPVRQELKPYYFTPKSLKTISLPDLTSWTDAQKVIQTENRPVVLYFGGPNCPLCAQTSPIVKSVAAQMIDSARFYAVNAEENTPEMRAFVQQCNVQGLPSIRIFKDGQLVAQHNGGAITRPELIALVDRLIA